MAGQNQDISTGDFIQCGNLAYYGFVIGQGTIGRGIPVWKVDVGGDRVSVIPKRGAKLLYKGDDYFTIAGDGDTWTQG